jgi:hypothetical protein
VKENEMGENAARMGEMRNASAYKILVRNPEGRRTLDYA